MWVLSSEADDRAAGLDRRGWSAGPVWVGRGAGANATACPDGLGRSVTAEHSSARGEDRAVVGFEKWT
jgi:hypothetical protein